MRIAASVNLPRWSVILLAPWLTLGAAEVLTEQGERRRAGVVGVVGKWTEETRDGDAVIVGDGPAAGETTSAAVSAAATTLFGAPDTAFVANATSASAFSLAVLPNIRAFSEGTFRAKFKLVSGKSDQTAGLVFDLKPTGEYLFVRYNTKEGNIALWRYNAGDRAVVARGEQKAQLPLGRTTWRSPWPDRASSLRLERIATGAGRVGFWTKRDSVTLSKDVAVDGGK